MCSGKQYIVAVYIIRTIVVDGVEKKQMFLLNMQMQRCTNPFKNNIYYDFWTLLSCQYQTSRSVQSQEHSRRRDGQTMSAFLDELLDARSKILSGTQRPVFGGDFPQLTS